MTSLADALNAVDWHNNITEFLKADTSVEAVVKANTRLAVWAKQLETIEKGNPALCFVREMQSAGHHVATLIALALYKPAASAARGVVEAALYYTYYRAHHVELATLVRDPNYFIDKPELIDYHKRHTPDFGDLQGRLGLVSKLSSWYSNVSAVLHGQIPGTWVTHKSLTEIKHSKAAAAEAVNMFVEGEELVHRLFLCTVGRELWGSISTTAKKLLVSGLSGSVKAALGLDSA